MPLSSGYYAEKFRENALELVVCDLVREKEATWGQLPKDTLSSAITGLALRERLREVGREVRGGESALESA